LVRKICLSCKGLHEQFRNPDITLSSIALLPDEKLKEIVNTVCENADAKKALRPLLLFDELPAFPVWRRAIGEAPERDDWEQLKITVLRSLDHQSETSTDCRWARVLFKMVAGQVLVRAEENVEGVLKYPYHGDLTLVRPHIRATEITFDLPKERDRKWSQCFWRDCLLNTRCEGAIRYAPSGSPAAGTTRARTREVRTRLSERFLGSIASTAADARIESIFGIAAYSLALLEELLNVSNSSSVLGRLGLRTILYSYITLAYLLCKDNNELWLSYRNYGLGQAKLSFLKIGASDSARGFITPELLESLANEDRWMEFVDIDLGHWAGTNLRQMSIGTNNVELYETYYPWTSGFGHSNWAAVRNTSFGICVNPLHRLHRVLMPDSNALGDVIQDACGLIQAILDLVHKEFPEFDEKIAVP